MHGRSCDGRKASDRSPWKQRDDQTVAWSTLRRSLGLPGSQASFLHAEWPRDSRGGPQGCRSRLELVNLDYCRRPSAWSESRRPPIRYVAGVEIQVLEGALVEVPTADVSGMDRRAFGEFVGPHGELASYAFGWTTGSDPHVARLSIGIGAGNPGGGTFHAVIFANEDGHAFSLVDEPFSGSAGRPGPDRGPVARPRGPAVRLVGHRPGHAARSASLVDAALASGYQLYPDP